MNARNPFQGHEGYDTVHNVVCGLEFLSQCFDQARELTMLEDLSFGQFLILQTLAEALRGAKAQFENERKRPNAQTSATAEGGGP